MTTPHGHDDDLPTAEVDARFADIVAGFATPSNDPVPRWSALEDVDERPRIARDRGRRLGAAPTTERHLPCADVDGPGAFRTGVEDDARLALRDPKGLRASPALLLPLNPFLDDWGQTVGSCHLLGPEDVGEVVVETPTGLESLTATGFFLIEHLGVSLSLGLTSILNLLCALCVRPWRKRTPARRSELIVAI